jgi:hypothetical protein
LRPRGERPRSSSRIIKRNCTRDVRDAVRMANQITDFIAAYPKQEALDGIAKHIHATWEPRLRKTLKAHLDTGGPD